MSSVPDLDTLLAELGTRRARLLRLVEPSGSGSRLLAELQELNRQLILAEDHLRAQQDELDSVRQSLLRLIGDRQQLRRSSRDALVDGYVQPGTHSSNGTPTGAHDEVQQFGWLTEFSALAEVLDRCRSRDAIARAGIHAAPRLIPNASHVGLVLIGTGGVFAPAASSSFVARQLDEAQLDNEAGPLFDAVNARTLVRGPSVRIQVSDHGRVVAISSTLTVPLISSGRSLGALSLYAEDAEATLRQAEAAATALAYHLGAAVFRVDAENNLRDGLKSRQLIGEAIGVLRERRRLTSEEAFDELCRRSQQGNVKLREIARMVLDGERFPSVPREP